MKSRSWSSTPSKARAGEIDPLQTTAVELLPTRLVDAPLTVEEQFGPDAPLRTAVWPLRRAPSAGDDWCCREEDEGHPGPCQEHGLLALMADVPLPGWDNGQTTEWWPGEEVTLRVRPPRRKASWLSDLQSRLLPPRHAWRAMEPEKRLLVLLLLFGGLAVSAGLGVLFGLLG